MSAAHPPNCTLAARFNPNYLREGCLLDRENRVLVTADGRPLQLSYQKCILIVSWDLYIYRKYFL